MTETAHDAPASSFDDLDIIAPITVRFDWDGRRHAATFDLSRVDEELDITSSTLPFKPEERWFPDVVGRLFTTITAIDGTPIAEKFPENTQAAWREYLTTRPLSLLDQLSAAYALAKAWPARELDKARADADFLVVRAGTGSSFDLSDFGPDAA